MATAKTKVSDLAKSLGMSNAEMLELCKANSVPAKTPQSTLVDAYVPILKRKALAAGLVREVAPVEEEKPVKKAADKKAADKGEDAPAPVVEVVVAPVAPVVEAPAAPVVQAPAAPVVQAPVVQAPVVQAPAAPVVQAPVVEAPVAPEIPAAPSGSVVSSRTAPRDPARDVTRDAPRPTAPRPAAPGPDTPRTDTPRPPAAGGATGRPAVAMPTIRSPSNKPILNLWPTGGLLCR